MVVLSSMVTGIMTCTEFPLLSVTIVDTVVATVGKVVCA
jgi:hypothetical protein